MSEQSGEREPEQGHGQDHGQGIPDEALPEDVRPAEDNPLADPDHEIGGGGGTGGGDGGDGADAAS